MPPESNENKVTFETREEPVFPWEQTEPYNLYGIPQDYRNATVAVLQAPYDYSTSYKPGARFGPHGIIEGSRHNEEYDRRFGGNFGRALGVYTTPEVAPVIDPYENVKLLRDATSALLSDGKWVLMLGGDHSTTLGPVWAYQEMLGNGFVVVHIDAHVDSRPELSGNGYSHGCVVNKIIGDLELPVVHVGIRDPSQDDMDFLKATGREEQVIWAEDMHEAHDFQLPNILDRIKQHQKDRVYVTLDIDVLDPSIMPTTGTAFPNGLNMRQLVGTLRGIGDNFDVIGGDLVEYAPFPGGPEAHTTAAHVAHQILAAAHIPKMLRKK